MNLQINPRYIIAFLGTNRIIIMLGSSSSNAVTRLRSELSLTLLERERLIEEAEGESSMEEVGLDISYLGLRMYVIKTIKVN